MLLASPLKSAIMEYRWFARLRWAGLALEAAVVSLALFIDDSLPAVLGVAVALHVSSNVVLQRFGTERWTGPVILADVWLLSGLLCFSGGATNPFTALFFVHVTLAAALLGYRWTCATWLNALFAYGVTFFFAGPHAHHMYGFHLYGMFIAFAVASALIGASVAWLSISLRRSEEQLRKAELAAAQSARVVSLTTLAAGAAHELGSPLATIAIAASELSNIATDEQRMDVELIQSEVRRCRVILDALAMGAGEAGGESAGDVAVVNLLEAVRNRLGEAEAKRLIVDGEGSLRVPRRAVEQMLHNLVRNAFDATKNGVVSLSWQPPEFIVRDEGAGMDERAVAQAFDPFFSLKEAGSGMGLGLFLVRSTADAMGAVVSIDSEVGVGTTVRVTLPGIQELEKREQGDARSE